MKLSRWQVQFISRNTLRFFVTHAKIIEKARKTIVEVGYPMHEEAIKNNEIKSNKEWEESKQKEAANRRALDNMVKNKIKGFDI